MSAAFPVRAALSRYKTAGLDGESRRFSGNLNGPGVSGRFRIP
jgi:hypothetical protein